MRRLTLSLISILLFAVCFNVGAKVISNEPAQRVIFDPAKKECFNTKTANVPWSYCVYTPANGAPSKRLAYMLHGRSLDQNIWNDDTYYTAMIQKYWQDNKITPPTVVTISFGPVWLLAPRGKMPSSGLLDLFVMGVIPEVEARLGTPFERVLFGESMGGLNSLVLGLKQNTLFKKVAALCAPIYLGTPFDSESELEKFFQRTSANRETMAGVIQLAKTFYADKEEWANAAPIPLLEKLTTTNNTKYYVSCGLYDRYGNFEGADAFATQAKQKGLEIEWHLLYGPHCAIDVPSTAEFLAH